MCTVTCELAINHPPFRPPSDVLAPFHAMNPLFLISQNSNCSNVHDIAASAAFRRGTRFGRQVIFSLKMASYEFLYNFSGRQIVP